MEERKYVIHVRTPNKMFLIHGKPVRTPAEFVVTGKDRKIIEAKIRADGIDDYEISSLEEAAEEKKHEMGIDVISDEEPEVVSLEEKPQSTLDSLLDD